MRNELSYLPSQAHNPKCHLIIQLILNIEFYILLSLKPDDGVLKSQRLKSVLADMENFWPKSVPV